MTKHLWLLLLLILVGCEDKIINDNGPCRFPGPNLNYSTYDYSSPGGYFNLQFLGEKYAFRGDQVQWSRESADCGDDTCRTTQIVYRNALFEFRIYQPAKHDDIPAAIGLVLPMMDLKTHNLYDSTSVPAAIQIKDYCYNLYDPITKGVSLEVSYNKITAFELSEVIQTEYHYYRANYWITGEFAAQFNINGVTQSMTGSYKLLFYVEEAT